MVDISDTDHKTKIIEVNNILEELGVLNITQIIVNNKCDLIEDSNVASLKKRKKDEVFISAESETEFKSLRSVINKKLFNGVFKGWVSMENNLGNVRSTLFDMGCVKEEKIAESGKMFANISIGNNELNQFIAMKGFELCHVEDILLETSTT